MIKQRLKEDLKKAVEDLGFPTADIFLSISPKPEFGDYSTNIALQLAKQPQANLKQNPEEIAKKILGNLGHLSYLDKSELKAPGFINFFIKPEVLAADLKEIKEKFGWNNLGVGQKVVLEHTGVNPNKAMHIGHLRNAVLGDTLVRILKRSGYKVEVQNYIDDTGVQVTDTYVGTKYLNFRSKDTSERLDDYYWDLYSAVNRRYEEDPNFLKHREEALKAVEDPGSEIAGEVKKIATEMTEAIEENLAKFDIFHDLLVWESDILKFKLWQQAFELLKKTPGFEKEEVGKNKGTWLVRFGEGGDDEHTSDKIFVRSNGTATYTAKDFAYNLWKFGLLGSDFKYKLWGELVGHKVYTTAFDGAEMDRFDKGDLVYNVIDERQSYLQQVILEIFKRLGYKKQTESFKHVAYGVVTLSAKTAEDLGLMLSEQKKSYAMAGRKGIGIKVRDLLDLLTKRIVEEKKGTEGGLAPLKIATSAIKYYMLKYNPSTEIIFDFDQAISLYGATGPYLQYTHARAFSILDKAGKDFSLETGYLPNGAELSLIKKLLEWPDLVKEAERTLEPSSIATFAFELAQLFNTFYEKNRIINAQNPEEKAFRVILVQKFQMVFKDVLGTLGIEAPKAL